MQNQALYKKYLQGKHWENHPILYAERFSEILKSNNFHGELIDLGCGTGRDTAYFQSQNIKTIGIDISPIEIAVAKENHPECTFKVEDAESLNLDDNSIQAYFMINVMHYVDQKKTIREIFRTLKPLGIFFVHFNLSITDQKGNIDYEQPEEEIMNLFNQFSIIERHRFTRQDTKPVEHTHVILELVLQKP